MKWHRSYWHVSQYEVTLPKWPSGQGVGFVTWGLSVQASAGAIFFFFFFHSERIDAAQQSTWTYPQIFDLWVSALHVAITCLCLVSSESILTILKGIFRKCTLSEKFWRSENFFSPCWKNFFFNFFFLNSCVNLQVRPKINGFYQERKFSLG